MNYVQQQPRDNDPRLHYFVPRQLLFLVEHDNKLNRRQIADLVKWSNRACDDADLETPHQVLSFPRTRERPAFSLMFANVRNISDEPADLLRLLNRLEGHFDDAVAGMRLRSVSPNWFGNRAPYVGSGSPGSKPVPADPLTAPWQTSTIDTADTPYSFKLSALPRPKRGPAKSIEVAVLDTAPCLHDFVSAYHRWEAEHPLIKSLLKPGGQLHVHPANYADLVRLAGYELRDHQYDMADHGLFVAGIIHTIAPYAELRLHEVLNPQGVGDVESIAVVLNRLLNRRNRQPLVINMSLVVNIPSQDELRKLIEQDPAWGWLNEKNIERVRWPLEWICDVFHAHDVPIIAAAGNDAYDGYRPQARYPAAFPNVLGVGALEEASDQPTAFSNLADEPPGDGIMTFGGGVNGDVAIAEAGMRGIYIGGFPDGSENKSGWAWWSGTSFAAPVITGCIASAMGYGESPRDAVQKLRDIEAGMTAAGEEIFTVRQG